MNDNELHFSWDPDKAARNVASHGVSFESATFVFDDPNRLENNDDFAVGEYRMIVIGKVDSSLLTVVYTEPEENHYRLISARLANSVERNTYEDDFFHP